MSEPVIITDITTNEIGYQVQDKIREGGIKFWKKNIPISDNEEIRVGYLAGYGDYGRSSTGFYKRECPNATFITAEQFLANPRLVPGWDDGKTVGSGNSIISFRSQTELDEWVFISGNSKSTGYEEGTIRGCREYIIKYNEGLILIRSGHIGGCNTTDGYKQPEYDDFERIEASEIIKHFKSITPILKGSNMSAYQVRAVLKAENRAGVGMIALEEVLPITTIDAEGSHNAAFLAGKKAKEVPDTEAHRLQVVVKDFA
jgi:hypothetical protein